MPMPLNITLEVSPTVVERKLNDTLTYTPHSTAPPIVPSIKQLHNELIEKYKRYGRDPINFIEKPSVKEIAKLLTVFHNSAELFILSNGTVQYYP